MVNTTTGQGSASPTASWPERLGRTRLRAVAASFRQSPIRLTRPFRSTTVRDQTSSRRICVLPRHLVSGNPLEQRLRDRGRAGVRGALVDLVVLGAPAAAEVVPGAVVVDV